MKDKSILYELNNMKVGQKIKIFSLAQDVLDNDKVDIYKIDKEIEGLYLSYYKKNSMEYTDLDINFRYKLKKIGSKIIYETANNENLTSNELKMYLDLRNKYKENTIIKNCDLEGEYENEIVFSFKNVIQVEVEVEVKVEREEVQNA